MAIDVLKGSVVEARLWAPIHEIESSALAQIKNLASIPWAFHHVCCMPDVHAGVGCVVGSVFASKEAIAPAAVGVDIGCFTGDNLIPISDGNNYPIKELIERKEFVVYSCNKEGKAVAAKATAKLTRKNAKLLKVTLDNGKEIKCTPDHQFLLRDGSYLEAEKLTPYTSLMPFRNKQDKDGYTLIYQPDSGSYQRAHWIIARSGLLGKIPAFEGQKTIIHHKNFNESDNSLENLEFMGDKDHSSYHRSLVDKNTHWQSEEFEAKRKEGIRAYVASEEGYVEVANRASKNILTYMEENPEHFKDCACKTFILRDLIYAIPMEVPQTAEI